MFVMRARVFAYRLTVSAIGKATLRVGNSHLQRNGLRGMSTSYSHRLSLLLRLFSHVSQWSLAYDPAHAQSRLRCQITLPYWSRFGSKLRKPSSQVRSRLLWLIPAKPKLFLPPQQMPLNSRRGAKLMGLFRK